MLSIASLPQNVAQQHQRTIIREPLNQHYVLPFPALQLEFEVVGAGGIDTHVAVDDIFFSSHPCENQGLYQHQLNQAKKEKKKRKNIL